MTGIDIPALHINLTVVRPSSGGYAAAYPGPERSDTSTVNFTKKRTVANGAFVGTSVGSYLLRFDPDQPTEEIELFVIKVFTTSAAWIVVDLSGAYVTGSGPVNPNATAASGSRPRHGLSARSGNSGSPDELGRPAIGTGRHWQAQESEDPARWLTGRCGRKWLTESRPRSRRRRQPNPCWAGRSRQPSNLRTV